MGNNISLCVVLRGLNGQCQGFGQKIINVVNMGECVVLRGLNGQCQGLPIRNVVNIGRKIRNVVNMGEGDKFIDIKIANILLDEKYLQDYFI